MLETWSSFKHSKQCHSNILFVTFTYDHICGLGMSYAKVTKKTNIYIYIYIYEGLFLSSIKNKNKLELRKKNVSNVSVQELFLSLMDQ